MSNVRKWSVNAEQTEYFAAQLTSYDFVDEKFDYDYYGWINEWEWQWHTKMGWTVSDSHNARVYDVQLWDNESFYLFHSIIWGVHTPAIV
jgi:hypothetical protein